MLYEHWLRTALERPAEIALREGASGRQWTFGELADAGGKRESVAGKVAYPRGISAEFVIHVLQAWRDRRIVCPLEPGQAAPVVEPPPEGIVHLKTTSATNGRSRLVAFTAEQLAADAENIVATMGLRQDWPNLGVISLAHSYGFSNLILPLLLHGVPLILADSPLPESVRRAAAAEGELTLAAVPALWRAWLDAEAIPPNVRLAISAGAPLPVPLEEEAFVRRGLKIHNFYGSSECGGIAFDASTGPRQDGTCAGAPLHGVQCAMGSEGCLEVRSSAVGQTYWPQPAEQLQDGIFRTSDLAELSGGLVYLRGRSGDQINVAGRKVSPETIERVLLAHPAVRECVVFGTPSADVERSEKIVACVALKTETPAEELKKWLLAELPAWQVPRDWRIVDSLAASARGKLSRTEWRERLFPSPGGQMPPGLRNR